MKKEFAKITEIQKVYRIKIYKLGFFQRLKHKHEFYVDLFGEENKEYYVDRIYLEGVNKVFFNGGKSPIIQLYTLDQLILGVEFIARITEYPDNEFSVIWIHKPEEKKT